MTKNTRSVDERPIPWFTRRDYGRLHVRSADHTDMNIQEDDHIKEKIVRAVNSHDALVDAVEAALKMIRTDLPHSTSTRVATAEQVLIKALAIATGRP